MSVETHGAPEEVPMHQPRTHRSLGIAVLAASVVATTATLSLSGTSASAHAATASSSVDRPCGLDAPWRASVTATSGTYQATWTAGYDTSTGASAAAGPARPVTEAIGFDLGPFAADVASVDVTLTTTWYKAVRTVVKSQVVVLERPPATECPTTDVVPAAPQIDFDCAADTVVVIGAADTDAVHYTVVIDDGAGEGTDWSVHVTASARDGYVFPEGTTTEWTETGTVDCDEPVVPDPPSIVCRGDALALDLPANDRYSYVVDGDLAVAEGADYAVTVRAHPAPGQTFDSAARTEWVFVGTLDCIDEEQLPPPKIVEPPSSAPPAANPPVTRPPTMAPPPAIDQALELPRTGAGSLAAMSALAAALTAAGALILTIRRRSSVA